MRSALSFDDRSCKEAKRETPNKCERKGLDKHEVCQMSYLVLNYRLHPRDLLLEDTNTRYEENRFNIDVE